MKKLIYIDGPDLTGKTTMINNIVKNNPDIKFLILREPFGGTVGKLVRSAVLDNANKDIAGHDNNNMAMIMASRYAQYIDNAKYMLPNNDDYDFIIFDRSFTSTAVFQTPSISSESFDEVNLRDMSEKAKAMDNIISHSVRMIDNVLELECRRQGVPVVKLSDVVAGIFCAVVRDIEISRAYAERRVATYDDYAVLSDWDRYVIESPNNLKQINSFMIRATSQFRGYMDYGEGCPSLGHVMDMGELDAPHEFVYEQAVLPNLRKSI